MTIDDKVILSLLYMSATILMLHIHYDIEKTLEG